MKRLLSLSLGAGLLLLGAAPARADTIYQVLTKRKEFSTLRKLLAQCPPVRKALNTVGGQFTFLAPTDAAYARLDTATRARVTDPKRAEAILLSQVLDGKLTQDRLNASVGKHLMTYTRFGVQILKTPKGFSVAGANLVGKPIAASNGMVQIVDRPMTPPPGMPLALPARKPDPPKQAYLEIPIGQGKTAPAFTLKTPSGARVTLAEISRGQRATLVYFWFIGCPPCRAAMPELNAMYERLKDHGLGMIGINTVDSATQIEAFAKEQPFAFPIALNGTGPNDARASYLAEGAPTYVVVGADGKVLDSFMASDKPRLTRTLARAGVVASG